LAVEYVRTYQLTNALLCLRRWLEREPDRLEAWALRANVSQKLQKIEEALASYRRILELDPDNDDARLQMAGHLAQRNQVKEALRHFEHLHRKLGDTPAVLKGLACCRRLQNQPDEARRLLDAVLAQQPRDWRALAERGRLALQFESAAEAEPWLRRAAAAAPNETDVYYSLAQCLEQLGQHREAEEVVARLKRVETDLARMADLCRQIARTPHDPALRCEAGIVMMRNGQEMEGLRWLASALEEDPDHPATHQALADYYERIGDAQRAAEHRALVSAGVGAVALPRPDRTR
jgi:predicted Zn-dependent protease